MRQVFSVLSFLIASAYVCDAQLVATYIDTWHGVVSDTAYVIVDRGSVGYTAHYLPRYNADGELDEDSRGYSVPYWMQVRYGRSDSSAVVTLPEVDERHVYAVVVLNDGPGSWEIHGLVDPNTPNLMRATYTYMDLTYDCVLDVSVPQDIGPFILRRCPGLVVEASSSETGHRIELLRHASPGGAEATSTSVPEAHYLSSVDLDTYRSFASDNVEEMLARSLSIAQELDIEEFSITGSYVDPLTPTIEFSVGY